MPPVDSETPAVNLDASDAEEYFARRAWQKELDPEYEHRMKREGAFWHDPALDGLSDNDRKWAIVKMGFMQVAEVLAEIGLLHYWEYFLQRGLTHAFKLNMLTQKYVRTKMIRIKDEDEIEAILEACANCMQKEENRFFIARYGDPDSYMLECHQARRLLSEKTVHDKWLVDEYDLTGPMYETVNSYESKWSIPRADKESFDLYDEWVAAGGADGFLFMWPIRVGETKVPPCVRCKVLHGFVLTDFKVDWQRKMAASCGFDNKICIYDMASDDIVQSIMDKTYEQAYLCIDADLSVNKLAAGTNFGYVRVFDIETGKPMMNMVGHKDHCRQVQVDWDSNLAVTCSWDSYLHIYDLRSAKLVHRLVGHNGYCKKLDVDFEKQLAVSSANENRFILWDLRQMDMFKRYDSPGHNVSCFSVDWNNMELCTGADDGLVKFWKLETGECTSAIDCRHEMTLTMDVDWERRRLVTGSWDYLVDMWDIETGEHLQHFHKPRRTMTQVHMTK
eukprot:gb/GFBE01001562.1/.p1 GENE.gb/GFBE01001562.1/~~gb/GFBE01001562.1/.p1  ORF type:complete len:504 (+),score=112.24 gb/GFBE01001562.1/:1-1512(+)